MLRSTGTDTNTQSFFQYVAIAPNEYFYTFAKVCFPIKITEAILGMSGFKHEFGDWYINIAADGVEDGLPFLRYKHSDKCWYLQNTRLWAQPVYLHQLQNLYHALSHQELPVRLGQFENIVTAEPVNFFVKPLSETR